MRIPRDLLTFMDMDDAEERAALGALSKRLGLAGLETAKGYGIALRSRLLPDEVLLKIEPLRLTGLPQANLLIVLEEDTMIDTEGEPAILARGNPFVLTAAEQRADLAPPETGHH